VLVTFESDWKKAKGILVDVMLTLRYLCDPKKRRSAAEAIWGDILERFAGCDDIDFAYPTHRLCTNTVEGKPGARAEPPPR
jgi:hypothetical protein